MDRCAENQEEQSARDWIPGRWDVAYNKDLWTRASAAEIGFPVDGITEPAYLFRLLIGAYISGITTITITSKEQLPPSVREVEAAAVIATICFFKNLFTGFFFQNTQ
jgi:hypothetical protein